MPRFPRFAHAHSFTSFHHFVSSLRFFTSFKNSLRLPLQSGVAFSPCDFRRSGKRSRSVQCSKSNKTVRIDRIAFSEQFFFSQKVRGMFRARLISLARGFLFPNARKRAESQFFRAESAESVRIESDTARSNPRACPAPRPS